MIIDIEPLSILGYIKNHQISIFLILLLLFADIYLALELNNSIAQDQAQAEARANFCEKCREINYSVEECISCRL